MTVENAFTRKIDVSKFLKELNKSHNKSQAALKSKTPAKEPTPKAKK